MPNLYLQFHKSYFPNANGTISEDQKDAYWNRVVSASEGAPIGYEEFLSLMTETLGDGKNFTFNQRVAVGLGVQTPSERGISLHSVFGTPVFPGSGIKGMLLREAIYQFGLEALLKEANADDDNRKPFAWQDLPASSDEQRSALRQMQALFGDIDGVGRLKVYDALWVPGNSAFLMRDVTTQHNKPYYNNEGYPDDTAGPNPIGSVSLSKGITMRFWLDAGDPEWTAAAYTLLELALNRIGIGAKTSSGYGSIRIATVDDDYEAVTVCTVESIRRDVVIVRGRDSGLLEGGPPDLQIKARVKARRHKTARKYKYVSNA